MIKRMRLKFFAVTSTIVFGMMWIFCGTVLASVYIRNENRANDVLQQIIDSFDKPFNLSQLEGRRIFAVKVNSMDQITAFVTTKDYTQEQLAQYIEQALTKGSVENFKILVKKISDGKIVAAIDMSIEKEGFKGLTFTLLFTGGCGLVLLLTLVWVLSYWIVKPAEEGLEKQRRFISEASHELRTPLTVISTGIELLQSKKNNDDTKKWLADIKQQTQRMTVMTADLLALSRLDEAQGVTRTEFDISQAILNESLTFESVAFEHGKQFVSDIEEGLIYKGDSKAVSQALWILYDNAIKHSDDGAIIKAALKRQSSKICLTISNTGENLAADEIPYLFERFYRGKESRAKIPGTGLGLSILKSLAEKNGWKISVKLDLDRIIFAIIL